MKAEKEIPQIDYKSVEEMRAEFFRLSDLVDKKNQEKSLLENIVSEQSSRLDSLKEEEKKLIVSRETFSKEEDAKLGAKRAELSSLALEVSKNQDEIEQSHLALSEREIRCVTSEQEIRTQQNELNASRARHLADQVRMREDMDAFLFQRSRFLSESDALKKDQEELRRDQLDAESLQSELDKQEELLKQKQMDYAFQLMELSKLKEFLSQSKIDQATEVEKIKADQYDLDQEKLRIEKSSLDLTARLQEIENREKNAEAKEQLLRFKETDLITWERELKARIALQEK